MIIKNRGAVSNPEGRFEIKTHENYDDGWERFEDDELPVLQTMLFEENPKTLITTNDSPDIGFDQSINPYRGCEHGCIYCYARPAHGYMNLSAGIDFETKIFYKNNAAAVLERDLAKKNYICKPIVIGGNTDPYQPAESKLKITRSIIEVLHRYQHPFSIITKNTMIERDMDLIEDMARKNLVKVAVSVTTLSTKLKVILEPRTSAPKAKLRLIKNLSAAKIPLRVMTAPIIPMINDMELEQLLEAVTEAGARHASYVLVRLPHEVKDLFKEWLEKHFPERAKHVMSIITQMRGGKAYDSTFGKRMVGEGEFARLLALRYAKACRRLGLNQESSPPFDTSLFIKPNLSPQMGLWDTSV